MQRLPSLRELPQKAVCTAGNPWEVILYNLDVKIFLWVGQRTSVSLPSVFAAIAVDDRRRASDPIKLGVPVANAPLVRKYNFEEIHKRTRVRRVLATPPPMYTAILFVVTVEFAEAARGSSRGESNHNLCSSSPSTQCVYGVLYNLVISI